MTLNIFCCFQDDAWHRMEEERPALYEEAVVAVSPAGCGAREHVECVRGSNRYRDLCARYTDTDTRETRDPAATCGNTPTLMATL